MSHDPNAQSILPGNPLPPTVPGVPPIVPGQPPDPISGRRDWEVLQDDPGQSKTDRLRIVQGWLYRTSTPAGVAMVFVSHAHDTP